MTHVWRHAHCSLTVRAQYPAAEDAMPAAVGNELQDTTRNPPVGRSGWEGIGHGELALGPVLYSHFFRVGSVQRLRNSRRTVATRLLTGSSRPSRAVPGVLKCDIGLTAVSYR